MSKGDLCTVCGRPVPADAPSGHCPHCLIGLGFCFEPSSAGDFSCPTFGDFELLHVLGVGGMGVVYKARQISLNRFVALKMLSPQAAAFPATAERIRIEAEAAASLHHPHIVTIYEVGEHESRPFFSMELVEGTGLDKAIRPEGFVYPFSTPSDVSDRRPHSQGVLIMAKIARAVEYAHKHGVLHRDLKPANVILDADGEPHLTDFGVAKIVGRERGKVTQTGFVLGTPAYMAPEQALGESKHVSTAADIYSLGAILYEMLTGQPPFRGPTPLETIRQVTEFEPRHPTTFNSAIDKDLATICMKCLRKDPQKRYPSAQALAEDLERWLRHEPIDARDARMAERIRYWCRREPRLAALIAVIAGLLSASALLAWTLYAKEKDRVARAETVKISQRNAVLTMMEQASTNEPISISPAQLVLLLDKSVTLDGNEVTVRLGIHSQTITRNPYRRFHRVCSLLPYLQPNLLNSSSTPALFELRLYNHASNAVAEMLGARLDILGVDPAFYVLARKQTPTIVPLVQQLEHNQSEMRLVIYTRADSGVYKLEDLRGKSFAFGEVGTAAGHYAPQAELAARGLKMSDFQHTSHNSFTGIFKLIKDGACTAGVGELDDISQILKVATNVPMRILLETSCPTALWVTRRDFDRTLASTIQQRLLSLSDSNVLAGLDHALTGFRRTSPADYDGLERKMEEARLFDPRHVPLTNAPLALQPQSPAEKSF